MFYAVNILSSKGKLSAAWVAAHFDRRLSKSDIQQVNIEETVKSIEGGEIPELALRTSSHILLGLSKILFRKTKILYDECKELFISVKRKDPSSTNIPERTSKSQITYPIDLFAYIKLPVDRVDSVETGMEIEMARGSVEGLLSNFDYSISLNNISLSLAETLEESRILDLNTEQESMHQESFALSAIPNFEPSEIERTLVESPRKRIQRARSTEHPSKRQKLDQVIEIENKHIKPCKLYVSKEEKTVVPYILKGIYNTLQMIQAHQTATETKDENLEGSIKTDINSELQETGYSMFNNTFNDSFNTVVNDSIEVARGESVLAPPPVETSFLQMESDHNVYSKKSVDMSLSLSVENISAALLTGERREKTQAFMQLLRRVTEGSAVATQTSLSAYSPIIVST